MITLVLILAALYVALGLITVGIFSWYVWQPRTWSEVALQFAVWPFLAFVMLAYHLGGGK